MHFHFGKQNQMNGANPMATKISRRGSNPLPKRFLQPLREICLGFPEAYEESAWTGVRWRIKRKTFAHVLMIDEGWPPAYAHASGVLDSACVLTFRASQPKNFACHPFFRPRWFPNIVGMIVEENVEWRDVRPWLEESYRLMAPRKLAFAKLSATPRGR
jgi:hypothetical protein